MRSIPLLTLLAVSLAAQAAGPISWKQVRLLRSKADLPEGCTWVSTVETGFAGSGTRNGALKHIRKKAAKQGATYIVLQGTDSSTSGVITGGGGFLTGIAGTHWEAIGDAYRCPANH